MERRRCSRWMMTVFLAGSVVSLGLAGPTPGQAAQETELRSLTAFGSSDVRVRPDQAVVRVGVETEAQTAAEAREQNAVRVNKVVDALRSLKIPDGQIETAAFQIYPVRRFEDESRRGEPPVVGYRVVNIVVVRTEQLDLVPRVIDDSVGAGANRVESVSFELKDEGTARQMALRQAIRVAKENAMAMAREMGVQLGEVRSVQQGGVRVVPPSFGARMGAFGAEAPTPVFPGDITVEASVTLTYVIR